MKAVAYPAEPSWPRTQQSALRSITISKSHSTRAEKPSKPYPEFPLTTHRVGQWCKKIRGKIYYFGPESEPDAASAKYLAEKDNLYAGPTPHLDNGTVTIKDAMNAFLNFKKGKLDSGELSHRNWLGCKEVTDLLVKYLGKGRLAADLRPENFVVLRGKMAKKWGVDGLSRFVPGVRSLFKHAFLSQLIDRPMYCGPDFSRPSKKTIRFHRTK